ncbi:hypothetical protein EDD16DRAFT_1630383 [Pisolithus croceorrhizus]|nr:hypothetical protein EDD16DRAFT_1630383 [Pisolithus croceorrhizus]
MMADKRQLIGGPTAASTTTSSIFTAVLTIGHSSAQLTSLQANLPSDSTGTSSGAGTTTTSTTIVTTTTLSLQSTYVSTTAAGSTVGITATIVTSEPSTATISTQSSSSSGTPIAVIVGGIVGGVVILVVLVLLFYFFKRRSSKKDFNRVSEPDRVINRSGRGDTLSQLDPSDEANNITPFDAYATDRDEEKQQYDQSSCPSLTAVAVTQAQHQMPNSSVPPSSASYGSDGQFSLQRARGSASGNFPRQSLLAPLPQGAALPTVQRAQPEQPSMYDTVPAVWHAPRPDSSLPPSANASSGSAKEREAADERGTNGLGVAHQCEPLERSESPLGPAGGRVVVHRDAGRVPEEVDTPQEIPPAYDSIQH